MSLADRVPESTLEPDDILDAFIEWVDELGLELYEAQEEAIFEIVADRHVVLNTPTGSGKSLVASAAHFYALCRGQRSVYTSPIKALVSEKFFALCETFGAERVGMLTGDASINPNAPVICCTAEVLANVALRSGDEGGFDYVIMDEFHYYSDRDRGWAWQVPLLLLPSSTFLLMSATLGDLTDIRATIEETTGKEVAVVTSTQRPVPLEFSYVETPIHDTVAKLNESGKAPIYIVNFTQRECAELAQALTSLNLASRENKEAIWAELGHFRFNTPYGKDVRRFLNAGVGIHHAGLLPRYRLLVERLAQKGLLRVIVGTDTLGVGINVPIRTVLFTRLYKYDGTGTNLLSVRDFKQIAGRAGRRGFDDVGYVVCQAPEHLIENKKLEQKAKRGKKVVKKKAPDGYVPYDEATFERLATSRSEALEPQFTVSHAIVLQLLQRDTEDSPHGEGYRTLVRLILRASPNDFKRTQQLKLARELFHSLLSAGIIETAEREDSDVGSIVIVNEDLQENFSLFQALSLYLVNALENLNMNDEDFALDVLSLAEAILENPGVILRQQLSKAKGELVAQLKEEGLDYEDRMKRLDEVTWPKPLEDLIYESFNAFREEHPWVSGDTVKPKSIARDLIERYMSFNEYVKEYGLSRSEGVLLRYLSQAYKTAVQNVPEAFRTEGLIDQLAYLRAVITGADSSLVAEWETMRSGDDASDPSAAPERPWWADERALRSRIRAEMHALLKALAAQDWEEAAAYVRDDDEWTAEAIEAAMKPYFDAYGELRFDHAARAAELTKMERENPQLWRVRQTLLDPDDDRFWFIEAIVDIAADPEGDDPLLSLKAISD